MMTNARLPVPIRQTGMTSIDGPKASLASSILRVLRALRGVDVASPRDPAHSASACH